MRGRNTAILLGEFYRSLLAKGIPDFTAHELVQMHFGRLMEEDEMAQDFIVSSYDDDDD